ncbi:MAG TPA: sugar-binding protein [Tepidisphaeraceae bacterium]|jgi:ribose transport system substrate-binding protein|nr:sugar-binding protein [Tepidisphaeraceae bacterium]
MHVRSPIHTLVALALAGAMALVGCKKEKATAGDSATTPQTKTRHVFKAPEGKPLKFAFVTNNASDFWKEAEAGLMKYHNESGVQIDFKQPSGATVTEQNTILDDLLTQGYNGIAISVINPDEQTRQINKAASQTNVICVDSDCPNSNRLMYIGTFNYEAGKALGQQIVKLLPHGGKIAVFVGFFSADNARERLKGIEDAIAGHNIEIVAKKEDNKDTTKARTNPEDVINNTSLGVNLMCGLWSYNGGAIAAAIEASGKKGKILEACFDGDEDTLKGIENGTISCTCVQKPFKFGYEASKALNELATKGQSALPANDKIDLGVEVIDSATVGDYRARLAQLIKK